MTRKRNAAAGAGLPTNRRRFLDTLLFVIAVRLLITCILGLWELAAPTPPHPNHAHYINMSPNLTLAGQLFVKWDSYWYLNIVQNGYESTTPNTGSSNTAFAPLYPACIALFSKVGVEPWAGGVALSLICYLVMLYYLHEFGGCLGSERLGRWLMVFTSVFPSAWVFQMVYAESMFCMILTAFFVHCLRQQSRRAGAWAMLLPLTRIVGLVIVPALLIDLAIRARRKDRLRECVVTSIGATLGVIILGTVYAVSVGSVAPFFGAGADWPSRAEVRDRVFPLLWSFALHFADRPEAMLYGVFFIVYAATCAWIMCTRRSLAGWFCGCYLLALTQMPFHCHMRFLLPCIPLHAVLVERVLKGRFAFGVVVVLLALLQVLLARLGLTWRIIA